MNSAHLTNEEASRKLGADRVAVKMRLMQARSLLIKEYRRAFGAGVYYPDRREMVGDDGSILRWQIREFPTEPESPTNQQTSVGCVLYLAREE